MASNAIFTPRGLHVRLPPDVAFGLMAQLWPKVRPSTVLATTEAVEFSPTAASKLLALLGFALQLTPVSIAILCALGRVVPNLLALAGLFRSVGWTALGRLYRPFAGHGMTLVVVAALGAVIAGPLAAMGFLVGTLVGGIMNLLVDFVLMRRLDPRFQLPLSSTERFFLGALRLHAADSGQSLDLRQPPTDDEDASWRAALADYAAEHPDRARQSLGENGGEAAPAAALRPAEHRK